MTSPPFGAGYIWDTHWLDEDKVLVSLPTGGYIPDGDSAPSDSALIVHGLNTATCERATEAVPGLGPNLALPMP